MTSAKPPAGAECCAPYSLADGGAKPRSPAFPKGQVSSRPDCSVGKGKPRQVAVPDGSRDHQLQLNMIKKNQQLKARSVGMKKVRPMRKDRD
jgi:hypothetical protein